MHILVTRFPLESAHGGAEVQTLSLIRGLLERGDTVTFVGSCPVMLRECQKLGVEAMELDIGPPPVTKWGAVSFLWRRMGMQKKLESVLDQVHASRPIDAVVMMSLTEKLLLTHAANMGGSAVYWLEHDRGGRWLQKNPWLPQLRRLHSVATTICVSELSAQIYQALGWKGDRLATIPNGIDLSQFQGFQSQVPQDGMLHVGCAARLTADKGVDLLLRAIAGMPDVALHIAGSGPEERVLQQLAEKLQLQDRVQFCGQVQPITQFYSTIDILVLPSRLHDPFGLAAAEAMACGIPAVVTDACGIADYLTHGQDAVVVEADSTEAITQGISKLQSADTRERMGEHGLQTAQSSFSVEQMIQKYAILLADGS